MTAPGLGRSGPSLRLGSRPSLRLGSNLGRLGARPAGLGQVEHEDIDGPPGQERAGHCQTFVRGGRLEHDQPLQPDSPSHRLDRIQAPGKVHPGGDRTTGLGLGHEAQGERGPAARRIAAQGDRGIAWNSARADDRIEFGEAGPDHPIRIDRLGRLGWAARERLGNQLGGDRERADDPRSCRSPARPEGCESGRDVRGKARHGQSMIEQMFCIVKVESVPAGVAERPRACPVRWCTGRDKRYESGRIRIWTALAPGHRQSRQSAFIPG